MAQTGRNPAPAMLRFLKAFLFSIPLAFFFNLLLWLIVGLVGWNFKDINPDNIFALQLLKADELNDFFWPLVLWGLAFMQACLLLVPIHLPTPSTEKSALGPRIIAAAFLGGLFIAIPLFASIDFYYFSPKADPKTFNSTGCTMGVLGVWMLSWLIWIPVLLHRARGQADAVEKFVGKSVAGSAVGLALCLPWYYVLRKKQSCYCSLGGFWALVLGLWSLLIVGGPLLFILARDRRLRAGVRSGQAS
ncbi:MAG: hypothetical protein EBU04_02185 [Verrucomicrobia bacterium]|nr:hypothetical protein [Verrucomicrobiota bacterium]NBS03922.1 hypothetical protein [Verrucomicrobiota bacterium]NBY37002.1 hypothetical protein [Verrucomicrobiota bacterium]